MATDENRHDFVSIILTDEEEIYKPKDQLEEHYDHILEVKIENSRTKAQFADTYSEMKVLDPFEAFKQFYKDMQGVSMSEEEEKIMLDVINSMREVHEDETDLY